MECRCRLCAEYTPEKIYIVEDKEFCSKILHLFKIEVSVNDDLPHIVCQDCYTNVQKAWTFYDRIQKAQKILQELALSTATDILAKASTVKDSIAEPLDNSGPESSYLELQYIETVNEPKETEIYCSLKDNNESSIVEREEQSEPNMEYFENKTKFKSNKKRKVLIVENKEINFSWNCDGKVVPKSEEEGWDSYLWSCYDCNLGFNSEGYLKEHFTSVHQNVVRYLCADCPKVYAKRNIFISHVRTHRPQLKHSCDICYKWFPTVEEQSCHRSEHREEKQHICVTCGKIFRMESVLLAHVRSHLPVELKNKYQCDQCPKKFSTKPNLMAHKRIHTGVREYTCDQCGKSFFQKGNLDNHLLIHTAARPYPCDTCGKSFKTLIRLKKHTSVHSGLKPHCCDMCGRTFRERGTLKEHIRIHTGAMPFACEFCGKCFRFKGVLTTHRRQHTGERPYSCNECQHHFTNWPNYNKHMKRRHGINTSVTCRTKQDIPPTGMPHRNPPGVVLAPPQPVLMPPGSLPETPSQAFYPVLNVYNISEELLQTRV